MVPTHPSASTSRRSPSVPSGEGGRLLKPPVASSRFGVSSQEETECAEANSRHVLGGGTFRRPSALFTCQPGVLYASSRPIVDRRIRYRAVGRVLGWRLRI